MQRGTWARSLRLWSSFVLVSCGLGFGLLGACITDASSELTSGSGASSGNETGAGAGLGQVGSGGSGFGGGCAAEVYGGEETPLDMYIMLDKSGSMQGSKWDDVTSAIASFMNNAQSQGIGVGIQFFPYDSGLNCPLTCTDTAQCGAGCGNCILPPFPVPGFPGACEGVDSCNVGDYAAPEVAIAELPGVAAAVNTAMSSADVNGNTPTGPALEGAIQYATSHAQQNPAHNVIVVLATDGEPTSCTPEDIPSIAGIAQGGVNGTPSIKTFVIGVGNLEQQLDQIAVGGGTMDAFMVDAGGNVEAEFLAALEAIKGQALGCAYSIPLPESGEPDFGHVNVVYTPGGGSGETIPYVVSPDQCPPNGDGWYYDNAQDPTQILLCPYTCDRIDGDETGTVEVVLGCATVPL